MCKICNFWCSQLLPFNNEKLLHILNGILTSVLTVLSKCFHSNYSWKRKSSLKCSSRLSSNWDNYMLPPFNPPPTMFPLMFLSCWLETIAHCCSLEPLLLSEMSTYPPISLLTKESCSSEIAWVWSPYLGAGHGWSEQILPQLFTMESQHTSGWKAPQRISTQLLYFPFL